MKQENTNLPLWVIAENIDDHVGYAGQPVTIVKKHKNNYCTVEDKDGFQWYCGEEELKELPRRPLWKVLNEQRTKGEWKLPEQEQKMNEYTVITDDMLIATMLAIDIDDEEGLANAAYTALAVNNLHHLAEALDKLIKANMSGEGQGANWIYAKEAINRIS